MDSVDGHLALCELSRGGGVVFAPRVADVCCCRAFVDLWRAAVRRWLGAFSRQLWHRHRYESFIQVEAEKNESADKRFTREVFAKHASAINHLQATSRERLLLREQLWHCVRKETRMRLSLLMLSTLFKSSLSPPCCTQSVLLPHRPLVTCHQCDRHVTPTHRLVQRLCCLKAATTRRYKSTVRKITKNPQILNEKVVTCWSVIIQCHTDKLRPCFL